MDCIHSKKGIMGSIEERTFPHQFTNNDENTSEYREPQKDQMGYGKCVTLPII